MKPDPACILVVDDDPIILKMTARVLEEAGHQVLTGASGEEGLQLAQEGKPDLVLLDVVLPDIDGVEVCRRIKAAPPLDRPHVILLSGVKTETDAQSLGLESGADGYIARPVANRELLARVEAMLRLKQVEEALAEQTRELEAEVVRRIQVEEALRESEAGRIRQERLAAVGQLTTGLAHTFNNILTGLTLHSSVALRSYALSPQARSVLEKVQEQSAEAAALVEQRLEFSQQALLRRSRLDLADLLRRHVDVLKSTLPEQIVVTCSVQDGKRYAFQGDEDRLQEIFLNIALNARDAMPDGGTLHVDLGPIKAGAACSVCGQPVAGEWIQLTFKDSGEGIDAEILPRIFEPFFTTRDPERNGLGLSQVLGIVKQHGGHIEVESKVGEGTIVSIYLPAGGNEPALSG